MILTVVCLVVISIQLCYIICRDYFIYRKKGAISLRFSDMIFHHVNAELAKQNQSVDNCADQCATKCAAQCAAAYEAVTAQLAKLADFEAVMQKTIDILITEVSVTSNHVVELKSTVSNMQSTILDKQELHALSEQLTKQQSILLDIKELSRKHLDTISRRNDTDDTLVNEHHRKSMSPGIKKQSVVLVGARRDNGRTEYGAEYAIREGTRTPQVKDEYELGLFNVSSKITFENDSIWSIPVYKLPSQDYYGAQQVIQARNVQLHLGAQPIPEIQQKVTQLKETSAEATDNARRMYMDENLSIISDTSKDSGIPAGTYMFHVPDNSS